MSINPLLVPGLPRFSDIQVADVSPALDVLIEQAQAAVAAAETAKPSWDTTVAALDDSMERFAHAWSTVEHLLSVVNTPELRAVQQENMPRVMSFSSAIEQSPKLFANYKSLASSDAFDDYSSIRRRILETAIRDFRLGGAELDDAQKARFTEIRHEMAMLSTRFANNVVDATDAIAVYVESEAELAGLPPEVIATARAAAEKEGATGWKLTLQGPCLGPVLLYSESRELRKAMVLANTTKASDLGPAERDNTPIITRILELRSEMAALLGFANFAEYSLSAKMAKDPAEVLGFLSELGERALPHARRDRAELEAFARDELGLEQVNPWDLGYVGTKLMHTRYHFSPQEVKPYFPLPKVLQGLFALIQSLYGLKVVEAQAPVWHPDVRFYELTRTDGQMVGQFYLDPYARQGKNGGAWMTPFRTRRSKSDGVQTPIAFLVCNFGKGVGDAPATLNHGEVTTLFHEMGHGLHHLLSDVDEMRVSGLNNVEWDAVELPSQFMENFCWEWERLRGMSAHVETGEPLPRALFDRMLAARHFQSGMHLSRYLEQALFDMELHTQTSPQVSFLELLRGVRERVSVNPLFAEDRMPHGFTHIFAGGYAAGYYSYKWAEVLSADAYAAFEAAPDHLAETGERFRREVLAPGGSRPAIENFRAFRGRDPEIDALFRYSGLAATPAPQSVPLP
jgi:oligopeptidase A